ncbi:hypothetical protein [Cellulomonas sp. PhB150]|uniref:hypothetical protein n=1 Tax=Cellulomonas sp. PhB150 TaxID=2485188 RepID=UPI0011CE664E|nr:hypothetical protein [Cellulomonas sp. PhB150]
MSRWSLAARSMRAAGHGTFYVVMTVCFIAFVTMGVTSWLDEHRPVYWGTFHTTTVTCDPGPRGGCTTHGTWTSDDGRLVRSDVMLDGSASDGGTTRASYKPGGAMGDDENNVVHTAAWTNAGLWLPWAAAALAAVGVGWYRRKWRREAAGRSRRCRTSHGPSR